MNLPNYDNKKQELFQVVSRNWFTYIASLLPKNLDEMLRQNGCIKRFRGIHSGFDLLKVFFLYAVSGISFRMLALAAASLSISTISATAWRKQCSNLLPFLQTLFNEFLSSLFPSQTISSRPVYLIDASIFRQQGKEQHQQRVHMCYSLNENRMAQIKVTDHHTAESLSHFSMHKDDIFLADAGYATSKNYADSQEQKADVIFRMTLSHLRVYDASGQKIDLLSYLKEAKKKKERTHEIDGYVHYQKKRYFARVIIAKLPEEKAEQARKRKKRKASKNQYQTTQASLFSAGYILLITSLSAEYDREEILHLYRSRWQIELLFKRIKQNFKIQTIRIASKNYAEIMVYLWLLIWLLVERQAIQTERYLEQKKQESSLVPTIWDLCKTFFIQTKEILEMAWSLFVEPENETLWKYLKPSKCCRINQNKEFRHHILTGLIA